MENPFKFGTLVDSPYFTDRTKEQAYICQYVNSQNHLVLISPRRFGKSSLVKRAISQTGRPCISINMQQITRVEDLASMLLKGIFSIHKWEKMKRDEMDFSFNMTVNSSKMILEDTFDLLEKVSDPKNRIIVVFDEFQEIIELEKGIDKRLRAIMQEQNNINYIFLGSQESMMTDIFENMKSPFFHFGTLMHLQKIPYDDFQRFIAERLGTFHLTDSKEIATEILDFTKCHPYYTQQLSSKVWELLYIDKMTAALVKSAINDIVLAHDLDFERFWISLNKTDRRILQKISSRKQDLYTDRTMPTSTTFSSLKRLTTKGYIIRTEAYEIEDPFFEKWITMNVSLIS